jgi:anaerobic glycerol-3-phosphate dehydrogenase
VRTDRLVRFGFHLNDIDREMTNPCRCARSVPIFIEMNADLPSLDQLRSNAAECIRLAEAARTSQHKSLFIEMADRWLTLAEHAAREDRLNGGSLFRDR